jgi:hypothetical protein
MVQPDNNLAPLVLRDFPEFAVDLPLLVIRPPVAPPLLIERSGEPAARPAKGERR